MKGRLRGRDRKREGRKEWRKGEVIRSEEDRKVRKGNGRVEKKGAYIERAKRTEKNKESVQVERDYKV